MVETDWIRCPICEEKTRDKIRADTEMRNFPVFCPKCKRETLIGCTAGASQCRLQKNIYSCIASCAHGCELQLVLRSLKLSCLIKQYDKANSNQDAPITKGTLVGEISHKSGAWTQA